MRSHKSQGQSLDGSFGGHDSACTSDTDTASCKQEAAVPERGAGKVAVIRFSNTCSALTRAQAVRAAVSETGGHLPRGAHGAETVATPRERAAAGLRTATQPPRAVPQAEARPPVSRQLGLTCGKDLEAVDTGGSTSPCDTPGKQRGSRGLSARFRARKTETQRGEACTQRPPLSLPFCYHFALIILRLFLARF